MRVIDAHTHFKEKFLKVLTPGEIKRYLNSGVEYVIGVVDFFSEDWERITKELSELIYYHIKDTQGCELDRNTIRNLLWEEIDYCNAQIDMQAFREKIASKIFNDGNVVSKRFNKYLDKLSNFILPFNKAEGFIKHIKEEIRAAKIIRKRYGLKSYLCVGIHPLAIKDIGSFDEIRNVLKGLEILLKKNRYVIGIGECGIENNTELERTVLLELLLLAKRLNAPVIMHTPLTYGKIPADRKLKGISDMCKIVKKSKIDICKVAFDHITDVECINVINKEFLKEKPYVSFSMQKHWINSQKVADLVKIIGQGWESNIMVNSDFGTYQTPEAFTLLKKCFKRMMVSKDLIEKVLYFNAFRFFGLHKMNDNFNEAITKKYTLIIDFTKFHDQISILLSLKEIKDWICSVYSFKEIILLMSDSKVIMKRYFTCKDGGPIKIQPSYQKRKNSIIIDMSLKLDISCIYDVIEEKLTGNNILS